MHTSVNVTTAAALLLEVRHAPKGCPFFLWVEDVLTVLSFTHMVRIVSCTQRKLLFWLAVRSSRSRVGEGGEGKREWGGMQQQYSTAGWGGAGQGRAGQGRAGQGRAGQGRAGQGRVGQGRAGQGRAGQGRERSEAQGQVQGRGGVRGRSNITWGGVHRDSLLNKLCHSSL